MNIKEARINSVLNTEINTKEFGQITRREEMILRKANGWESCIHRQRDRNKEEKEQAYLSRSAFSIPFGNTNHPQTIAYNARAAALKAGIYKESTRLEKDNSVYLITKIEYDFFNSIN